MAHALREALQEERSVDPLFDWAKKQALEAARASDALTAAVKAEREAKATLEGLTVWERLDAAKKELAAMKAAALEADPAVQESKLAVKRARKAVRDTREADDLKQRKQESKAAEGAVRLANRTLVGRLAGRKEDALPASAKDVTE